MVTRQKQLRLMWLHRRTKSLIKVTTSVTWAAVSFAIGTAQMAPLKGRHL